MAKNVTGPMWVFDAANQCEGVANVDETTTVVFTLAGVYIKRIKLDTGDGGDMLIQETDGGRTIIKADNTPANDTLEWPIGMRVQGIFIKTLPANAQVHVIHGGPSDGN